MSTPTTTDPAYFHDSYFVYGKDHQGNERYYTLRLFAIYEDGSRRQVSLTLNEWQQQAALVQRATSDFFARPVALPDSFKINIQDRWKLTPTGHEDREVDLLDDASRDRFNLLFQQTLRYWQDTVPIAPLDPALKGDDLDVGAIFRAPPVGIHNVTGKDRFISAFLHAFVFTNPELMRKLWEKREHGNEAEIGRFLYRYQQAQLAPPGTIAEGVDELRTAIDRSRGTVNKYSTGAHDPTEVFDFLIKILGEGIQQEGSLEGSVQASPKDNDSLETCVRRSLTENPVDPLPRHLFVLNPTDEAFASVEGTANTYELKAFIQHIPGDVGHYIAYVRQGNDYYKCDGSTVEISDKNAFLEAAKNSRAALYV